ncbi:MAG: DUF58 domain-containing protein [Pseudomonadota bacterium]
MLNTPELEKTSSGIEVTVKELIALRGKVANHTKDSLNKWLKLPGQKFTRIRGRGIEFDGTREYQAGDDMRSMAWRVTARSLKPHIKVYNEERERPVWLAVDLSPSLYFGTRCMFKSVCSIKQAAFLGWSYLLKHERIGAIIATEQKMQIYKPQSTERDFLNILNSLAGCSSMHPAFNEKNYLHNLLMNLQQQARSGNLVFILSDFFQFDAETEKLILHIAQRAQVVLMFIYDPFEAEPPPPYHYVLTNGQQRASFDMENAQNRLEYQQQFAVKQKNIIDFSRKYNIALQILRTDQKQEE